MVEAALRSGAASRQCVFEVFARRLPEGRRYGVVAGTGRLLEAIERFRFGDEEIEHLRRTRVVDEATLEFLAGYRFNGNIWGYAEGECYFPYSPVLVVEADFAHGVVLETLVLSILNHDSAVASAASRMTSAAGDRPCIEMGSRRTHEQAAHRGRPRGIHRRLCHHLEPRGGPPLRRAHGGHRRARVQPAARRRAGGVRGADRVPRQGHHAPGRHLRRHERRERGRRAGRPRAGRRAARLRGPAEPGPRGAGPARRPRGTRHPDRRHLGPRRVRHRRPRGGAGGPLRRGDLAGHRLRRPDRGDGLQAGRAHR